MLTQLLVEVTCKLECAAARIRCRLVPMIVVELVSLGFLVLHSGRMMVILFLFQMPEVQQ